MATKQRKVATEFSGTFTKKTVQKWTKMVKLWEVDSSHPNPYISNERGMIFCLFHLFVVKSYDPFSSVEAFGSSVAVG